ncbi:MAG: hypothetical protein ACE5HP_07165 [Gemmatimonadota bacterium]
MADAEAFDDEAFTAERAGPRRGPRVTARGEPASEVDTRYRAALDRRRVADVQPLYRKLLVRLKSADPAAYEAAVARYEKTVPSRIAAAEADPLEAWIEYGMWLAARLSPGRAVAVDAEGRAHEVGREAGRALPSGGLLLHLPDEARAPALLLAMPREPSEAQRATVELLCA